MKYLIIANIRIEDNVKLYIKKGNFRTWTTKVNHAKLFKSYESALKYLTHNDLSYDIGEGNFLIIKEDEKTKTLVEIWQACHDRSIRQRG